MIQGQVRSCRSSRLPRQCGQFRATAKSVPIPREITSKPASETHPWVTGPKHDPQGTPRFAIGTISIAPRPATQKSPFPVTDPLFSNPCCRIGTKAGRKLGLRQEIELANEAIRPKPRVPTIRGKPQTFLQHERGRIHPRDLPRGGARTHFSLPALPPLGYPQATGEVAERLKAAVC
jgi:hypothetical protein